MKYTRWRDVKKGKWEKRKMGKKENGTVAAEFVFEPLEGKAVSGDLGQRSLKYDDSDDEVENHNGGDMNDNGDL